MSDKVKIKKIRNVLPVLSTFPIEDSTKKLIKIPDEIEYTGNLFVFIDNPVYEKIHIHANSDLNHEVGGVLIGDYNKDLFGTEFIIITDILSQDSSESEHAAHIVFTHKFWMIVDKYLDQNQGKLVLGCYHTHPRFGVFLSGTDRATILNSFNQPHHVAIVIDPVNKTEGYFVWGNREEPVEVQIMITDKTDDK